MDGWMDGWIDGTLYLNTAFYQIKIYNNIEIWFNYIKSQKILHTI